jgi:SAM-dependent methyltransferase
MRLHVHVSGRFLYEYARLSIKKRRPFDSELFLRAAYRAIVRREPDTQGIDYFRQELQQKRISRWQVLLTLLRSDEFRQQQHNTVGQITRTRLLRHFNNEYRRLKQRHPALSDDNLFVRAAYRALLQREPDPDGAAFILDRLRHAATRDDILQTLTRSDEFRQVQGIALHPWLRCQIYVRLAHEYVSSALKHRRLLDDQQFLQAAHRAILGREPAEAEISSYVQTSQRKCIPRRSVVSSLMRSNELKSRYGLPIRPIDALHQSRMILFQQHLPPAEVIVDLGGAAHNAPYGALLAMGYPHRPRQITIVDLPPDDRIGGSEAAETNQTIMTGDGIRISYLYRSMADLDPIQDSSVDLVISGESIEHISEADAETVCTHVYRMLRPGGAFCLDTPNARLTRLQSPNKLIHPEHQKEYYVHEIRAMLDRAGFQIVDTKAISPMPESIQRGVFDFQEAIANIGLSDNPEEGYMFYLRAQKPL